MEPSYYFVSMILEDSRQLFLQQLTPIYGKTEAEALFFEVLFARLGISRLQFEIKRKEEVSEISQMLCDLSELRSGKPLQHITGKAFFRGMQLFVSPAVLIPRPETEELVELVLAENDNAPKHVLDVGTGSGCIALGLAKSRHRWQVTGIDVSPEALEIARKNATANNVSVSWLHDDISTLPNIGNFDIIVSNPPYIPLEDAATLEPVVLNHEPHLALFAPKNDPLFFYRAIKTFAHQNLNKQRGRIYFETHYRYAQAVAELFFDVAETRVLNDMFGKPRFVVITYAND